jgi:acetoin utilization deacetylase AcuC-like enzyme
MSLRLEVFTAAAPMRQDEAPVDIHNCNAPATRRQCILDALSSSSLEVSVNEVPTPIDGSLDLARRVHDGKFVDFLETAWHKWASLEQRCRHFFGTKASGCDVPSLIPGNYVNRDSCQLPGESVYSQTCYYVSDCEVPIYAALREALVQDLAGEAI